jgi:hypothetical protein
MGTQLADKILFIGKAIYLLLRNEETANRSSPANSDDQVASSTTTSSPPDTTTTATNTVTFVEFTTTLHRQTVAQMIESLHGAFDKLHDPSLSEIENCWATLRQVVEACSAIVAERLWQLMVNKCDLAAHIRVWHSPADNATGRAIEFATAAADMQRTLVD